ncbi:lysophospholipid acyltransferase family protein [Micromonospora fluostatini]|uniref:lysophospholipid acyltransferase family protein n=1 Tax=Micromonospora sp. JCM 30529 TaxID=3421643 RepID=UPI003D16F120
MSRADDLWRPRSGCGPWCLPDPTAAGTGTGAGSVPVARRLGRFAAALVALLAGIGLAAVLPLLPAETGRTAVRRWSRGLLRALGVRLTVTGRLPRRRALLVANHISWLDVVALLATAPARMVAKREVRRWPLVGLLTVAAGTVSVDRSRPRALPATVHQVAATLRAGHPVAVFPEGTTWCGGRGDSGQRPGRDAGHRPGREAGAGCRPPGGFRPAMFQAAIETGAPVVPLRIEYGQGSGGPVGPGPSGSSTSTGSRGVNGASAAAFLGDETLWRSVRRVVAARDLTVTVTVTAALHPARDADRRSLARLAESAVHPAPARPRAPATAPPDLGLAA